MTDWTTKQDDLQVAALLDQDQSVKATLVEDQLLPALREEPVVGPVPDIRPEIHGTPDVSSLAAWMDDLKEYGDQHRGEEKPATLLDSITTHELDELAELAKDHKEAEIDAADEQVGLVPNFIADSALEGAAVAVPDGSGIEGDYFAPAESGFDPLGYNGGGSGGGSGGGWPNVPSEGGSADEGSAEEPDDGEDKPDAKQEKGKLGKLVDRMLRRDTAQQKPIVKEEPAKPPEKPKKP